MARERIAATQSLDTTLLDALVDRARAPLKERVRVNEKSFFLPTAEDFYHFIW